MSNNTSESSRRPAKNYKERARVVIERILMYSKALAGPDWREPTPELMEGLIAEFHLIMNWAADGARSLGFPAPYFRELLTEEEMRFVEGGFLRDVTIIRFD